MGKRAVGCRRCERACQTCGEAMRVLVWCAGCQGRKGGASKSKRKREASRENLEKARGGGSAGRCSRADTGRP